LKAETARESAPSIRYADADEAMVADSVGKPRLSTWRMWGLSEEKQESTMTSSFEGKALFPRIDHNPRREGTLGFNSMKIILRNPGITYAEFLSKGGRNKDLHWEVMRKRVVVKRVTNH
jgi:hypothetical protein